jgi:hypothetical protein
MTANSRELDPKGRIFEIFHSHRYHGGCPLGFFRFPEAWVFNLAGASLGNRGLFFPDCFSPSILGGQEKKAKTYLAYTATAGICFPNQLFLLWSRI